LNYPLLFTTNKQPSNEQEITSVYAADPEDVDIAVKAARKALKDPSWKGLSSSDRGKLLLKLADLVEENAQILATIETWDNGMEDCGFASSKVGRG
jgi:aldehyde dehydrogenase (NAD(P)+)